VLVTHGEGQIREQMQNAMKLQKQYKTLEKQTDIICVGEMLKLGNHPIRCGFKKEKLVKGEVVFLALAELHWGRFQNQY